MKKGTEGSNRGPQIRPVDPAEFTDAPPRLTKRDGSPRKPPGKKRKLTLDQVLDVAAWLALRKTVKTIPEKAKELDIPEKTLIVYMKRIRAGDLKGRENSRPIDEQRAAQ